jgi:multiple sugar transport system permease protein/putative aldouronate transport system permease protein
MIQYNEGLPRKFFLVFDYVLFAFLVFICIYPMWYIFISSLSGSSGTPGILLPKKITFENYIEVIKIEGFLKAFGISVLRTAVGTLLTVITSMFLAYIFTKETMPFRKILYRMLIITLYVEGGLIPTYLVIRSYGLLNNFWAYILPGLISAYYIILIKTYIEQLPKSIEESAMMDGAGTVTIFFKIIIPMSLPILATIAVFTAVTHWNSWFDNHIYVPQNKNLLTLPYMLYRFMNEAETFARQMQESSMNFDTVADYLTPKGIRVTTTMITVTPVLFIYPFLQRYFIKGITIGAVKG